MDSTEIVKSETTPKLEIFNGKKTENILRWLDQTEVLLKYQYRIDRRKWSDTLRRVLKFNKALFLQ